MRPRLLPCFRRFECLLPTVRYHEPDTVNDKQAACITYPQRFGQPISLLNPEYRDALLVPLGYIVHVAGAAHVNQKTLELATLNFLNDSRPTESLTSSVIQRASAVHACA